MAPKRTREPSVEPRKVRRSSGASEASTSSKATHRAPSKSPAASRVDVERQKAQAWAAQALPDPKKGSAKKASPTRAVPHVAVIVAPSPKTSSASAKKNTALAAVAAGISASKLSPKKPRTRGDSSAVTVSNSAGSSAAVAKAAAASGSRYGQIVRGLVIVHAAGLAVYMLRWLRPKAYVFPLPLEAFFAVGAIGLLHLFSGKL